MRELRDCLRVWKGTDEEKARGKFVDGLEISVEEEKKRRWRRAGESGSKTDRENGGNAALMSTTGVKSGGGEVSGGSGFLKRLRDEIYME